jgi:hypothetical protein
VTPEAGLYPVRIVYYQGGGGGNLEFFTYGANNAKILVNDRSNPEAVKAYAKLQVPPTLSVKLLADGRVEVTFQGRLLQSGSVSTPGWQEVAGATSPYVLNPTESALFFRATR